MSKKEKMGKCIMCSKETNKDDVLECNHYICGPQCYNDHMIEMWKICMGYK